MVWVPAKDLGHHIAEVYGDVRYAWAVSVFFFIPLYLLDILLRYVACDCEGSNSRLVTLSGL